MFYFMQKCWIPKFVIDPFWTNMFGVPQHLRETLGQKISGTKIVLEFEFREALFDAKNSKPTVFKDPQFSW